MTVASLATAAAAVAAAATAAPQNQLYGYGTITPSGTMAIAAFDVKTGDVSWSPPFNVASTDQGCNVAFGADPKSGKPVYFVPDGSSMQPPPRRFKYHTVDVGGAILRTVNATANYDPVFVGWDPADGRVFGLGSQPDATTTDIFSFDPLTGATAADVRNISWIEEMPSCVGAATGRADGYFFFINGIISHTEKQQLVAYDATTGAVANRMDPYEPGLISSITPWAAPNGTTVVLALLWPTTGAAQLVAVDPLNHKWEPTLLGTFTGGQTPLQGAFTAVGSSAYALMTDDSAPDGHVLMTADLTAYPGAAAITTVPVDLSHAPFGVAALGAIAPAAA